MRSALKQALCHRLAGPAIVVLALLLASPSLRSGLAADDYFHRLVLLGAGDLQGIPDSPLRLFVWADGKPATARAYMEVGMTSFWADPKLLLAYFRPVSSLTHVLDYALWPNTPWLMHAHSLLWFALALFALSRVYARLVAKVHGVWVGMLALLLYAIDDAHGFSLSWVANRNAIIALALALPVLALHDRARRQAHRLSAVLAPCMLALALLAGEAALAICAYLFAYALFLDPAGPKRGCLRLLPYVLVGLAWTVLYRSLGYGAHGSGLVVDPGREPLRFFGMLGVRLPALLLAQFAIPPADLWELYSLVFSWAQPVVFVVAIVVLLTLAFTLRPLLMRDRYARFWAAGTVLSALPVCAQFPHDRLLLFIGVGAMALVAIFLSSFFSEERPHGFPAFVAGALAVVHLGLAPLLLPLRVQGAADVAKMLAPLDRAIDSSPKVREQTVVLINPPTDAHGGYFVPTRVATGKPHPKHLYWLATGTSDLELERLDESTLRVTPAHGYLSFGLERMQRGLFSPFRRGDRVALDALDVEVDAITSDGRPASVLARFKAPLEDPHLVFLSFQHGAFVPCALPKLGGKLTLPKVDFLSLLP